MSCVYRSMFSQRMGGSKVVEDNSACVLFCEKLPEQKQISFRESRLCRHSWRRKVSTSQEVVEKDLGVHVFFFFEAKICVCVGSHYITLS
jgi:hypothetical protein